MIIYAPYIGDTIPAFTSAGPILVPFSHNPAATDYTGLSLRILQFADNKLIGMTTTEDLSSPASFPTINGLTPGLYYKFQIAYIDGKGGELYYSTIAIGKCVNTPSEISIANLKDGVANYDPRIYKGTYTSEDEPAYWYRYIFKDPKGTIIQDTGDKLAKGETYDVELKHALEYGKSYTVTLVITTANGLQVSKTYTIVKKGELPNLFNGTLTMRVNSDEGYIELGLEGQATTGDFRIYRSANGTSWDVLVNKITMLSTDDITSNRFKWRDYTVEHGHRYSYGFAQLGSNDEVSMIKSVLAPACDFEDMFLNDGTRQLKIKFDPKVSSFKTTLQEAKTDTMGSKYPFFSRNAAVGYKEFSIAGLISYQMDDNQVFMNDDELGLSTNSQSNDEGTAPRTTNLVSYNYAAERKFKLAVLEWLNNGRPKLFRSPAEGNYMVRLMNTSLSPNDTLGRMIHTFSTTAYECGPADVDALNAEGVLFIPTLDSTNVASSVLHSVVVDGTTSTYGLRRTTSQIEIPGPASNITLQLPTPSTNAHFYIDEQQFIIYGTTYFINEISETQTLYVPQDEANIGMVITYESPEPTEEPAEDDFKTMLDGTEAIYENIKLPYEDENGNIITEWNSSKYKYIYGLKAKGMGDDAYLMFGEDKIEIPNGANKEYLSINSDITITASGPLDITVSGQREA